ncbi:hypothetical protein VM1G_11662 [Cytospora mali]|uniref:Uncharacterized protein n=1 Tax=Cytospora mali TaxID=578113 RepID=A0A194W2H6_CYTMA|nr:hypothetical protein VM1G_11662 [Valsa mali]
MQTLKINSKKKTPTMKLRLALGDERQEAQQRFTARSNAEPEERKKKEFKVESSQDESGGGSTAEKGGDGGGGSNTDVFKALVPMLVEKTTGEKAARRGEARETVGRCEGHMTDGHMTNASLQVGFLLSVR